MSQFLLPEEFTRAISRRAVEIAQLIGPKKTGRGLGSLLPLYQPGVIGIEIPDRTAYIFDLDQGIQEHAMVDLTGRVIPIRNSDGTISFRRASASKIGKIPIITRASSDGRIKSGQPEWTYPRKDGLGFLQKSLQMSVQEWKRTAKSQDVINMLMKTSEKDMISDLFYGRPMI